MGFSSFDDAINETSNNGKINRTDFTKTSAVTAGIGRWYDMSLQNGFPIANPYTGETTNLKFAVTLSKSQLELCFNQAYNTAYHEPVEVNGLITQINIYDTPAKGILLFSKIFNRANGVLSSIVITDEINGTSLTKTYTFVDGKWKSTYKTYGGL